MKYVEPVWSMLNMCVLCQTYVAYVYPVWLMSDDVNVYALLCYVVC
jgi:hypothetical protein